MSSNIRIRQVLPVDRVHPKLHVIARLARHLRSGHPVVVPTETQYALTCDATSRRAIDAVRVIKGRGPDSPFSIFLPNRGALMRWRIDAPPYALALAAAFWPGPVTLVLRTLNPVFKLLGSKSGTVAVRVTPEPLINLLLDHLEVPLVATSANPTGQKLTPEQENRWLRQQAGVGRVIWARPRRFVRRPASTIIDCTGNVPRELRPGPVTKPMWNAVLATYVIDGQRTKR